MNSKTLHRQSIIFKEGDTFCDRVFDQKAFAWFMLTRALGITIIGGSLLALVNSLWCIAHNEHQLFTHPIHPLYVMWTTAGFIVSLGVVWKSVAVHGKAHALELDRFASKPILKNTTMFGVMIAYSAAVALILNLVSGINTQHILFDVTLGMMMAMYGFYLGLLVCRALTPE